MRRIALLLLLSLNVSAFAAPNYAARDGRFIDRGQEGWFFYEPELEPKKEPEKKDEPTPPPSPVETMEVTPAPPAPPAQAAPEQKPPPPLSAEWIRQNMQRYKDSAFEEGTPESVASLLYLQKYILDKISAATRAQPIAVMQNPLLDESLRAPTAVGLKRHRLQYNQDQHKKLIEKLSKEHGLWVFFDSTDPATDKYLSVLNLASTRYDFELFHVSVDGQAPPDYPNLEFRIDEGQAKMLGVIHTPATFLVNKEGEFAPLGQAGMALTTLLERITLAAQQHEWISDEAYNATQIAKVDLELTRDTQLIARLDDYLKENPDSSGFIPPQAFIDLVQSETP